LLLLLEPLNPLWSLSEPLLLDEPLIPESLMLSLFSMLDGSPDELRLVLLRLFAISPPARFGRTDYVTAHARSNASAAEKKGKVCATYRYYSPRFRIVSAKRPQSNTTRKGHSYCPSHR
jgi:hypothetical protein